MLRVLIFMLLLTISLLAQENNKGNISLTFNGEKIDLPIKTVFMQKKENIHISVRAEKNNEKFQQMVAMDIAFDKLTTAGVSSENFTLNIRTKEMTLQKGNGQSGKEFSIKLANDNVVTRFSLYHGYEKVNWETRNFELKMNINKINYVNNHLRIIGEVSTILRSGLDGFYTQEVAKIENGKFEIIL